jgi:hypothetical protein
MKDFGLIVIGIIVFFVGYTVISSMHGQPAGVQRQTTHISTSAQQATPEPKAVVTFKDFKAQQEEYMQKKADALASDNAEFLLNAAW